LLLRNYPGEESTRALAVALADPEGLVRHTAITNFQARDPVKAVKLVPPLLLDPLRAVRMQAAVLLADAPDAQLEPYQREARAEGLAEYLRAMAHVLDLPSPVTILEIWQRDLAIRPPPRGTIGPPLRSTTSSIPPR
jgi:hypothetical protein